MPATVTQTDAAHAVRLTPRYRVLVHNDDVTPMDYVVRVLRSIFGLEPTHAEQVMLEAHHTGVALVAVLPIELAEFRMDQAHSLARTARYPLRFSCEPEA
ncbi:MAG: ATP-dependent Clp protease adaptor ClpS [Planctomycetes bacterium]|nr:ATP-dependent Clp protease adaptor ClpS [Planctomycetota bacterium]